MVGRLSPDLMSNVPWSLLCRRLGRYAVANDIDAVAAPVSLVVGVALDDVDVGDAAQRQRQRAALARAGERFGLFRLQLQRHGPADQGGLAVFFLRRLVDRQHADVGQDDFRIDRIGPAVSVRVLFAPGKNYVDPVVGQDKAASAGFRRNFGRDGAHAGGQDRGHEARSVRLHQLLLADRLAGDEGGTRDFADDLGRRIGPLAAANEDVAGRRRRPGLPLQVLGPDRLAEADIGFGDEHVYSWQLRNRRDRRRLVVRSTGEICGNAAGTDSDGQNDNACGFHYASLSTLRHDASDAVMRVDQLFVKAWLMRRI